MNVPNTLAEARAQGITYKAWLYMCEQEKIEREQEEEEPGEEDGRRLDEENERKFADFESAFEPEVANDDADPPDLDAWRTAPNPEPIPEEVELVEAALKSPIARWIKGQLAMERWIG